MMTVGAIRATMGLDDSRFRAGVQSAKAQAVALGATVRTQMGGMRSTTQQAMTGMGATVSGGMDRIRAAGAAGMSRFAGAVKDGAYTAKYHAVLAFDAIKANARDLATGMTTFGRRMSFGVTLPVIALGAALLHTAGSAVETRSKFDAVYKGLAGGVREWAQVQSAAVGRAEVDYENYLARLQDTFVPLGFAREQAAEMSKTLTTLGIDLASFNNEAEPETIQNLTSAIVGNHEAVRRYGIIITEASLKAQLLKMGSRAARRRRRSSRRRSPASRSSSHRARTPRATPRGPPAASPTRCARSSRRGSGSRIASAS